MTVPRGTDCKAPSMIVPWGTACKARKYREIRKMKEGKGLRLDIIRLALFALEREGATGE